MLIATDDHPKTIERMAFTVEEFCVRNHISKNTYYKLKALGLGPREMEIGRTRLISHEEEAKWREARSNPKGDEAKRNAKAAKTRVALAKKAGKLAVQSDRHPKAAWIKRNREKQIGTR